MAQWWAALLMKNGEDKNMYNRILLTGAAGFVGTNLHAFLSHRGYNIIPCDSTMCDLRDEEQVKKLFSATEPDCVIHLAALCGGIGANKASPGTFMRHNLENGLNVINTALGWDVKQFINTGTICAYPKYAEIPFKEEDMWSGYPEETNAPYGIAKKALTELLIAYKQEYGFCSVNLYPTNMYGPFDNFDPESSHVIPAIILKVYEAMSKGEDRIHLWGTGSATRDFLYVDDLCQAVNKVLTIEYPIEPQPINIGTNAEYSIKETTEMICDIMGFNGLLDWDHSLPDGQPRRCVCGKRAEMILQYKPRIGLREGLTNTIEWFLRLKQKGVI